MDVIILAGGQAKRLRPLTDSVPKCMILLNGKPMLQYQLDFLSKYKSVGKIVLSCGYKWDVLKKHYGSRFVYSVEDEPLGTAGAIKLALEKVDGDEFIVLNADDINNTNIDELIKTGSNATVVSRFHSQFGIVEFDNGLIQRFREKPLLEYWANIGMHLLDKKIKLPDKGSLEIDVLPKLAAAGKLKVFKHTGYWITINTIKEMEEAQRMLREHGL